MMGGARTDLRVLVCGYASLASFVPGSQGPGFLGAKR